jgi:hypothetical protein
LELDVSFDEAAVVVVGFRVGFWIKRGAGGRTFIYLRLVVRVRLDWLEETGKGKL